MKKKFLYTSIIVAVSAFAGEMHAGVIKYDSHGKRNPFVPPSRTTPATVMEKESTVDTGKLEEWFESSLAGVIWDEQEPHAIIEDKIVSKGDAIRDCTVEEIKPGSVILQYRQKKFEVFFGKDRKGEVAE
jgi:hypothetical protein